MTLLRYKKMTFQINMVMVKFIATKRQKQELSIGRARWFVADQLQRARSGS
jgi:hypothetical protein